MTTTLTPEEIEARLREALAWTAPSIPQLKELVLEAADAIAELQRAGERAGEEIVGLTTALRLAEQALEIIAGKRQCSDNLMSHADVAREALRTIAPVML